MCRRAPIRFVIPVRSSDFRMHQRGSHWTNFREIWYLRVYGNIPRSSKFGYNRTKVSDIIPEDLSTSVLLTAVEDVLYLYSSARKAPFVRFHGNSQRFYIVDNYQQVNNNIKEKHCCVSIATVFTRVRHLVRYTCIAVLLYTVSDLYSMQWA